MNEQARAFLDKAKNERLISLGLIKEMKREYGPYGFTYNKFDKETKKYYREEPIAIDVTDEEFEKICEYHREVGLITKEKNGEKYELKNKAEKMLNDIITCFFYLGLVGAVICFIAGIASLGDSDGSGVILIVASLIIALTTITNWGFQKVFINISNNLHEINGKIR